MTISGPYNENHDLEDETASGSNPNMGMGSTSFMGTAFNSAALKALTDRTGYTLVQQNGQRKYGGPPPNWSGPPPMKCEVFVGKIPRDLFEDDLVPILEKAGKVYELRLMMDFSNHNRGYAFCTYTAKEEAMQAVRILNNYEIRPGRMIGVCMSIDNCRLFVGGIPKNRSKEETMHEMSQITEGVVDCIMYPSAADKTKNRGFAFIEYESHRAAAMARRKLIPGKILLWGQQIAVDWAEPEAQVDDEVMKSVKILYLRGLMMTTREEKLEEIITQLFEHRAVERVKKIRDFAFVHFFNREDAEYAFEQLNGSNIEGVEIEVTWAKPPDKDQIRYTKGNHKPVPPLPFQPNFFESGGTPFMTDGGLRNPMGMSYLGSPPSFGGAGAPANMFGYPSTGSSSSSSLPSTGRIIGKGSAGMRGAGVKSQYNRILQQQQQQQQIAAATAAVQRAANPGSLGAAGMMGAGTPLGMMNPGMPSLGGPGMYKRSHELLEEICSNNGWAPPVYTFMKTNAVPGTAPQFCCRVLIFITKDVENPMNMSFTSPRVCATMEEAKASAAETTLSNMISVHKDQVTMNLGTPLPGATPTPTTAPYGAGVPDRSKAAAAAAMLGGAGDPGSSMAQLAQAQQAAANYQLSYQLAAAAAIQQQFSPNPMGAAATNPVANPLFGAPPEPKFNTL